MANEIDILEKLYELSKDLVKNMQDINNNFDKIKDSNKAVADVASNWRSVITLSQFIQNNQINENQAEDIQLIKYPCKEEQVDRKI